MSDTRYKNALWTVSDGTVRSISFEAAQLAVQMDIRDELQRLNTLLHCSNFTSIPAILRTIRRNTSDLRKQKKPASRKV